jgi:hypothetical protein
MYRGRPVHREYGVDPQEQVRVDEVITRDVQSIPGAMLAGSGVDGLVRTHAAPSRF